MIHWFYEKQKPFQIETIQSRVDTHKASAEEQIVYTHMKINDAKKRKKKTKKRTNELVELFANFETTPSRTRWRYNAAIKHFLSFFFPYTVYTVHKRMACTRRISHFLEGWVETVLNLMLDIFLFI